MHQEKNRTCPFCEEIIECFQENCKSYENAFSDAYSHKCLEKNPASLHFYYELECTNNCGKYRVISISDSQDFWDKLESRKEEAKVLMAQKRGKEIIWIEKSPDVICNDKRKEKLKNEVEKGEAEFRMIDEL